MTNITRKRGDTYANEWKVISKATRQAIDITNYDFLLTVDPEISPEDDSNNLFQIVGVIVDAEAGIVAFALSEEQADNLGLYYYDLQMTDDSGAIRTIDDGKYRFTQDITKG